MLTLTNMANAEVPVVFRMLGMNSRACESEASASLTLKVLLLKISGMPTGSEDPLQCQTHAKQVPSVLCYLRPPTGCLGVRAYIVLRSISVCF